MSSTEYYSLHIAINFKLQPLASNQSDQATVSSLNIAWLNCQYLPQFHIASFFSIYVFLLVLFLCEKKDNTRCVDQLLVLSSALAGQNPEIISVLLKT